MRVLTLPLQTVLQITSPFPKAWWSQEDGEHLPQVIPLEKSDFGPSPPSSEAIIRQFLKLLPDKNLAAESIVLSYQHSPQ